MAVDLEKFVRDQLSVWPELAASMRSLKSVRTRQLPLGDLNVTLQCNPERVSSTTADVSPEILASRPCPLCADHRPECQHFIRLEGRKRRAYHLIVNRYPIFQRHFVIVREAHEPQSIWHRYVDMLDMAEQLPSCVIFYNGPRSGASIPDHLHFQAVRKGYMPLERSVDRLLGLISSSDGQIPLGISRDIEYVTCVQDAQLFHYRHFAHGIFALRATTSKSMAKMFYRLLDCAPFVEGEDEPRFNVQTWTSEGEYRAIVIIRSQSRSHHYFATGEDHYLIAPGCADMGGYFILPDPADFDRITPEVLREVLDEVTISEETEQQIIWRLVRTQPKIEVGIMSGPEIWFEVISDGAGPQKVSYSEGKILYNGALYDELFFEAQTISTLFAEPSFILKGVTIGVGFHWQRQQDQTFAGTLKFIVDGGKVTAVNIIGLEDYLLSVISSEMKASSDLEMLKAHAVISRSWVLSQLTHRRHRTTTIPFTPASTPDLVTYLENKNKTLPPSTTQSSLPYYKIVKWFDHEDHKRFDLCADDHCQRYQGLTLAIGENVRKAIDETWGMILTSEGEICDTRFSKCCGGRMEEFSTCWEDRDYPYLRGDEDPFCDTDDENILSKVLNDYDLETRDFHDWTVEYGVDELSALLKERSGIDIGTITDLIPLERGVSGRIKLLRIEGTEGVIEVGKELMIRRFLSTSHLKSSAFEVEKAPGRFILRGHGWGHGVGLCQIGAAVMASKGYRFDEILSHYYPGAKLEKHDEK